MPHFEFRINVASYNNFYMAVVYSYLIKFHDNGNKNNGY